ncbi:MAG: hypothetical protein P1P84_12210 [Deferrisomatales bacterium]|nr:hypothetical protein [Deferrisomatales bacterium]
MRAFVGGVWREGVLDSHRGSGECRIRVLAFENIRALHGLYFVRERKFRTLWSYLLEIGIVGVVRKVVSRVGERFRNEKFLSWGIGRVLESDCGSKFAGGDYVVFYAPCHPACVERIVLDERLVFRAGDLLKAWPEQSGLFYRKGEEEESRTLPVDEIAGWSNCSGRPTPLESWQREDILRGLFNRTSWSNALVLTTDRALPVRERIQPTVPVSSRVSKKEGVLFGYGNYAKTVILPAVKKFVDVKCIHEIDPLQIPLNARGPCSWDTSPVPRPDERSDIFFIAGFHHTHTSLAIAALHCGAVAVVEKPLATDRSQLAAVLDALSTTQGKLFTCFHKRYSVFNKYVSVDMRLAPGDPVSYHCIVHEVPLPRQHWYRWPNSKSRIVSNGCHWIDHFLFLNGFSAVRWTDVCVSSDGTINCSAGLENGAFFTMVLTDTGSSRIGVQNYVELRAHGVTVKIVNDNKYFCEDDKGVLRRSRVNRMQSYSRMYREIARKVAAGDPGDSLYSIRASTSAILAFEACLETEVSTAAIAAHCAVPVSEGECS